MQNTCICPFKFKILIHANLHISPDIREGSLTCETGAQSKFGFRNHHFHNSRHSYGIHQTYCILKGRFNQEHRVFLKSGIESRQNKQFSENLTTLRSVLGINLEKMSKKARNLHKHFRVYARVEEKRIYVHVPATRTVERVWRLQKKAATDAYVQHQQRGIRRFATWATPTRTFPTRRSHLDTCHCRTFPTRSFATHKKYIVRCISKRNSMSLRYMYESANNFCFN